MLTPIQADHYLADLLAAAGGSGNSSPAPHWSQDSGACFALMAEHGCYPFMLTHAGGGTTVTIGGVGQPFSMHSNLSDDEAALRYSIVMAVARKLELAGVRTKPKAQPQPQAPAPTPLTSGITTSDLLELVRANPSIARQVDSDMRGQPITDYDSLLWGAYGPAVVRIVSLSLTRFGGSAAREITSDMLQPVMQEAIAQASDLNFAKPPQVMCDYGILTNPGEYTYHDNVVKLVNLALKTMGGGAQQKN